MAMSELIAMCSFTLSILSKNKKMICIKAPIKTNPKQLAENADGPAVFGFF